MLEKFETLTFDESYHGWDKSREFNEMLIKSTEMYMNTALQVRGWISLNELYDSIGKSRVLEAQRIGWSIVDNEHGYVELEIEPGDSPNLVIKLKNMVKLF